MSIRANADRTIRLVQACCSLVRRKGMISIASRYLFHDEERNTHRIRDLDEGFEYLVYVWICRELMMLCDEARIFMNKEPDDLMIMVLGMAGELEMETRIIRKEKSGYEI